MQNIDAVLFDWDGTLLDSFPSGFKASMAVFQHFGITGNQERFHETYNPNWYETYRRLGIPQSEWDRADQIWRRTYGRYPPELYPFARATLETLIEKGYALGLVTSGNRDRVIPELERYRLEDFFSTRVYCEDTKEKKPHPAPLTTALERMGADVSRSVYVGDRPEDIAMGQQTGSFTIGVMSAYVTREALEAASPDLLLPDASHLTETFGPRSG